MTTWKRKLIRNYIMKRRIMWIIESWFLWWTSSQLGIWISLIMDLSILDRIPNLKVLAPDQGILKPNLTFLKTLSLILEANLIWRTVWWKQGSQWTFNNRWMGLIRRQRWNLVRFINLLILTVTCLNNLICILKVIKDNSSMLMALWR